MHALGGAEWDSKWISIDAENIYCRSRRSLLKVVQVRDKSHVTDETAQERETTEESNFK